MMSFIIFIGWDRKRSQQRIVIKIFRLVFKEERHCIFRAKNDFALLNVSSLNVPNQSFIHVSIPVLGHLSGSGDGEGRYPGDLQ